MFFHLFEKLRNLKRLDIRENFIIKKGCQALQQSSQASAWVSIPGGI